MIYNYFQAMDGELLADQPLGQKPILRISSISSSIDKFLHLSLQTHTKKKQSKKTCFFIIVHYNGQNL